MSEIAHEHQTLDGLRERREEILEVARQHGATSVRVFGSVARGEDDAKSDIDLLVELEAKRNLLDLAELHLAMSELLDRDVDVTTPGSLKERIRDRVLSEAVPL